MRREAVVVVRDKDILHGVPNDGHACPIAIATARAFGLDPVWDLFVGVDGPDVYIRDAAGELVTVATLLFEFPIQDWLDAFDEGKPVEPFSCRAWIEDGEQ